MAKESINRNIVECKFGKQEFTEEFDSVLIETLWNVNQVIYEDAVRHAVVLIETLWNVNLMFSEVGSS